jgi:hypothetical protein
MADNLAIWVIFRDRAQYHQLADLIPPEERAAAQGCFSNKGRLAVQLLRPTVSKLQIEVDGRGGFLPVVSGPDFDILNASHTSANCREEWETALYPLGVLLGEQDCSALKPSPNGVPKPAPPPGPPPPAAGDGENPPRTTPSMIPPVPPQPIAGASADVTPVWVVLGTPGTLMEALMAVCGNGHPFPATVVRCAAGLAVQLPTALAANIQQQAEHRGWSVSVQAEAEWSAESRPLAEVLEVGLERVDVNALAFADQGELPEEYILGCNSPQNAQRVLAILLAAHVRGLQVRPLNTTTRADGHPYLFWHVRGGAPVRPALEASDRVWWGPSSPPRSEPRVFTQWPYRLVCDPGVLERMPWGVEHGLALLSATAPRLIAVPVEPCDPPFVGLPAVADFRVDQQTAVVVEPAETADTPFEVELQLVSNPKPWDPAERIKEVTLEIQYRQGLLERLQDQIGPDSLAGPPVYEPLFIYLTNPGEIPIALRRLLVEWCDQPQLRDEVLYARLDSRSLPLPFHYANKNTHLLATRTAVRGHPGRDGQSEWLRDYEPINDGLTYRVLPEWLPFGPRIFIPDDDRRLELYPELRPELYPEFRPGQDAGRRLAEALLPPGADADDYLILFLEHYSALNSRSRAVAVPLRKTQFCPLIEVMPWKCSAEVGMQPATVEGESERAAYALLERIEAAVAEAVSGAATTRVAQVCEEFCRQFQRIDQKLRQRLDQAANKQKQFDSDLQRRMAVLRGLQAELTVLDQHLVKSHDAVAEVRARFLPLLDQLEAASATQQRGAASLDSARRAAEQLSKLSAEAARLAEVFRQLESPTLPPAGGTP